MTGPDRLAARAVALTCLDLVAVMFLLVRFHVPALGVFAVCGLLFGASALAAAAGYQLGRQDKP